jgi:hypothetical protein
MAPGGRARHPPAPPGTHEQRTKYIKKPSKTLPNSIFKIFADDNFHPS